MFRCKIITDSINPQGNRLTSFLVTYPRIVHAEMLRHRMFSRNVASSRAIPFEKMVKDVEENPFIPIAWQKDHKGMQGTEYFTKEEDINNNIQTWLTAKNYAIKQAEGLNYYYGVTKQLCNRLLEPFMWTTELITTSEEGLMNFFDLRCPQYKFGNTYYKSKRDLYNKVGNDLDAWDHEVENWWYSINQSQAEIHIQKIAEMMWDCYNESIPDPLDPGEYHLPFGDIDNVWLHDYDDMATPIEQLNIKLKIATARCARLSYQTLGTDPKIDYDADIKLHDKLLKDKHMSPFEHCARAMTTDEYFEFAKGRMLEIDHGDHYSLGQDIDNGSEGWCRNFKGWISYRYLIETKEY